MTVYFRQITKPYKDFRELEIKQREPMHRSRFALRFRRLTEILPAEDPGAFNQATMDLGAMVCLPNGAPK